MYLILCIHSAFDEVKTNFVSQRDHRLEISAILQTISKKTAYFFTYGLKDSIEIRVL